MVKRLSFFTMLAVLLAVLALSNQPLAGQTVPEPTDTPVPPAATNTPPPTNTPLPAATNTPPAATATPVPGATATPTSIPAASATATPTAAATGTPVEEPVLTPSVDAALPADACADAPVFVVEQDVAAVKAGPSTLYATTTTLDEGAVRTIVGRYAFGAWWLIRLNATTTGWIADTDGIVVGRTVTVPLVAAPARNGATPTPATSWNPTPNPDCIGVPTSTPTATPTPTPAPSAAASDNTRGGQEDEIVVVSGSEPEEDAPTATVVSTQAISDVTEESPTVIESDTASQNTPVPPASDVIAETTPIWPLLIGIGLVGAAVVTFIVVRARGSA